MKMRILYLDLAKAFNSFDQLHGVTSKFAGYLSDRYQGTVITGAESGRLYRRIWNLINDELKLDKCGFYTFKTNLY